MEELSYPQIEQSVLGALIDKDCSKHIEQLSINDFSTDLNKKIFENIVTLANEDNLNIISLSERVKDYTFDYQYISKLTSIADIFNIEKHIEQLKEARTKRDVVKLAHELIDKVKFGVDINTSLYQFESDATNLINVAQGGDDDTASVVEDFFNWINDTEESYLKWGIPFLDEQLGGLYKKELVTIAAQSGVGKTALALQIARSVIGQGKKVLIITREMDKKQILARMISSRTGISTKQMKSKDLDDDEHALIIQHLSNMNKHKNIYINDTISTISGIKKRIREIKPDLLIVDYLQLLTPEGTSEKSREQQVAKLSREMKNITLDFDMPVIQLSQLNGEDRGKRPWGDMVMRESKAIFHDSNSVIYIHEPIGSDRDQTMEKHALSEEEIQHFGNMGSKLVELIISKARDGGVGFKAHWYQGKRLFFKEVDDGGCSK